jgi:hypothetical protein
LQYIINADIGFFKASTPVFSTFLAFFADLAALVDETTVDTAFGAGI